MGGRGRSIQVLRHPLIVSGSLLVLVGPTLAVLALLAGRLDPTTPHIEHALHPPSLAHPMGTDQLGRDTASRVLAGTLLSPGAALVAVGCAGITGTVFGLIAGWWGGVVDLLILRVADVFLAFPGIILSLVIARALNAGLPGAMIAISLVLWPAYARLTRDQVQRLKHASFVSAARALGASGGFIMEHHLLPHVRALLLVQASFDVAGAIAMLAGLSYIGIGAAVPDPEWGMLIQEGYAYLPTGQWWLALFPTLALLLVCGGLLLISDGLREVAAPRSWPRA
jgi:peptide/nickel transport system permease protein